ncbi:MAG TPA: hypothetical protein VMB49_16630 [Acidobacteriaceae bacterium]|nr:hypothetical protein [Acidobacteriaceae bacterium]
MTEDTLYSLQLRLVKGPADDPAGHKVELTALPEGPGEPRQAHFEHWEPLSDRLSAVASSTPFHLKAIYRTMVAGLTAPLIDRATGHPLFFSLHQLKDLGLAN